MATLDFRKIMPGWKNTMPNDFIGAELINRSNSKVYFSGDHASIMRNIKTNRVSINHEAEVTSLNSKFDGNNFIEVMISGI